MGIGRSCAILIAGPKALPVIGNLLDLAGGSWLEQIVQTVHTVRRVLNSPAELMVQADLFGLHSYDMNAAYDSAAMSDSLWEPLQELGYRGTSCSFAGHGSLEPFSACNSDLTLRWSSQIQQSGRSCLQPMAPSTSGACCIRYVLAMCLPSAPSSQIQSNISGHMCPHGHMCTLLHMHSRGAQQL